MAITIVKSETSMVGHLYRYPHPHDPTRFIYSGQGPKRDERHRSGKSSFGRRFQKKFPNIKLPQPLRESVGVENQIELNELETIWMFRFHTWQGYPDGMNLTIPGSQDYKLAARIGGLATAMSGQLAQNATRESCSRGGYIQGIANVKNGNLALARTNITSEDRRKWGLKTASIPGHMSAISGKQPLKFRILGGQTQGSKNVETGHMRVISCFRWNISRNKPCVCGKHKV
jgi:hypothetical protein